MNQLKQTIMKLINDGKEIDIAELSEMELEPFEIKQVAQSAVKQQKLRHIRNTVRSTAKSVGKMIRNTRKNAYKTITEEADYRDELAKLIRQRDRTHKKVEEFKAIMLEAGHAVQEEMEVKEGVAIVKDTRKDQVRKFVGTSKQSKKAASNQ